MRRRAWLAGVTGLAGCSVLPEQPYLQRRDWPLQVQRPSEARPRAGGKVLLVRSLQAAPGLDSRGLQWKLPDGSLHVDFYEQWAVPPAQAIEDSLRLWLAGAGLFAAVIGPGSRLPADLVLEGELTEFAGDPQAGIARASLALVLLDERPKPLRVLLQWTVTATAPLSDTQAPSVVQALRAALDAALRQIERDMAAAVG